MVENETFINTNPESSVFNQKAFYTISDEELDRLTNLELNTFNDQVMKEAMNKTGAYKGVTTNILGNVQNELQDDIKIEAGLFVEMSVNIEV